jgi:hypothetical protein
MLSKKLDFENINSLEIQDDDSQNQIFKSLVIDPTE